MLRIQFFRGCTRLSASSLRQTVRFYASDAPASAKKPSIESIAPAGTVLKGLNIRKKGTDVIALKEEEYPEWLWEVLDDRVQAKKLEQNPDAAAHKSRRATNRQKIKGDNFLRSMNK